MKGATDIQMNRAFRTRILCKCHYTFNCCRLSGDDYLLVGVVVRRDDDARIGRIPAQVFDRARRCAEDRCHGSGTRRPGGVHQLTACTHETQGIAERNGASSVIRGELSKRMPRCRADAPLHMGRKHTPHGRTVREQCRLRDIRPCEVIRVVAVHQRRETRDRSRESAIGLLERRARFGERVRKVAGHAGFLRPLAGKNENDVHATDQAR
jgi:hypothetical protein